MQKSMLVSPLTTHSGQSKMIVIITCEFLINTFATIKNDCYKRLKPTDKKGVSTEMHYKNVGPGQFLPPLLHM
jgi:hypothetical protein